MEQGQRVQMSGQWELISFTGDAPHLPPLTCFSMGRCFLPTDTHHWGCPQNLGARCRCISLGVIPSHLRHTVAFLIGRLLSQGCRLSREWLNFAARWKCGLQRISGNSINDSRFEAKSVNAADILCEGRHFLREGRQVFGIPVIPLPTSAFWPPQIAHLKLFS